jgi:hypothetical protein
VLSLIHQGIKAFDPTCAIDPSDLRTHLLRCVGHGRTQLRILELPRDLWAFAEIQPSGWPHHTDEEWSERALRLFTGDEALKPLQERSIQRSCLSKWVVPTVRKCEHIRVGAHAKIGK